MGTSGFLLEALGRLAVIEGDCSWSLALLLRRGQVASGVTGVCVPSRLLSELLGLSGTRGRESSRFLFRLLEVMPDAVGVFGLDWGLKTRGFVGFFLVVSSFCMTGLGFSGAFGSRVRGFGLSMGWSDPAGIFCDVGLC
jgi:hypothetical protein